ncbi:hypothetical protein HYV10_03465 [Candidatus Dependentiae bacterium]|nr:hypothetical protein [Candidatus Dependentiae bacterium]
MKHSLSYTDRFNRITYKQQALCTVFCFFALFESYIFAEYEPNKILGWAKENFKQAEQHQHDYITRSQEFIRNLKVYDMLSLRATFDVMLLTDKARMLFVDYHGKNQGLTFDEIKALYHRQVHENRYFISAYVIAWHDEYNFLTSKALFTGEYQKTPNILKGDDALWNVSLIVGGRKYLPETVKVVEMPVEYQRFFGAPCNQFCTTYLVRFAAKDKYNNFIFDNQKCSVVLRFSSPVYKVDAIWKNINIYESKD